MLGICSALAVTNLVTNTLYMGFGVTFTTALTSFTIALLRNYIPVRIRMIVQVIIIAVYVMVVEWMVKLPLVAWVISPLFSVVVLPPVARRRGKVGINPELLTVTLQIPNH